MAIAVLPVAAIALTRKITRKAGQSVDRRLVSNLLTPSLTY